MVNLVLVESPAKIKKIQSFLGNEYDVMATVGHIRQLPKDELGFSIENNFEPTFEIIPDKKDVVKKIIARYKTVDKVILCCDDDNEGHSIAWHCAELLKLPTKSRYRATFNEITKKAVCTAITTTLNTNKLLDMRIVYAQFARMVLDKLIGYKVSPLLWKEYNNWKLSAGRVQSVVVKIIAERETEIGNFNSEAVFKLEGKFVLDPELLGNRVNKNYLFAICDSDIKQQAYIETLFKNVKDGQIIWIIDNITKNNTKRNPPPTFTTSTLQQEASARLGMSPDVCMKTAQKLYEAGLITYMRTDANFIAEDAMKAIKTYVETKWDPSYYRRMEYKTKSASAQEGHECCRPVDFNKENILGIEGLTRQHNSLYQLIWRRTVASQMSPAELEIRTVKIVSSDVSSKETKESSKKGSKSNKESSMKNIITFVGKHEKVTFEGYLKCMNLFKVNKTTNNDLANEDNLDGDDEEDTLDSNNAYLEKIFSKLTKGMQIYSNNLSAIQKYTKPPHARYTEASLVKKLDDLGIGRPSTYASMIKKVQEEQRQYVERKTLPPKNVSVTSLDFTFPDKIVIANKDMKIEGDKNKLFPTPLGTMINEYLSKNFIDIMNYEFTAQIEALLDDIAIGKKIWYDVVNSVYVKLTPIIDQLSRAITTRKIAYTENPAMDTDTKRFLGNHPDTNLPVYALKSRKGLLICESNPDKDKSRFASFTKNFNNITLSDAVALLIFPRTLGVFRDLPILLKKAKNVYISYDTHNYSIENYCKSHPKETIDPDQLTLEQAQTIILYYEQLGQNASKDKQLNDDITIKNGPFGAYIKYKGTSNIPLPKALKTKAETLTLEQCLEIVTKYNASDKGKSKAKAASGANAASGEKVTKPKAKAASSANTDSGEKVKKPRAKAASGANTASGEKVKKPRAKAAASDNTNGEKVAKPRAKAAASDNTSGEKVKKPRAKAAKGSKAVAQSANVTAEYNLDF